jgi:hypothetical protein
MTEKETLKSIMTLIKETLEEDKKNQIPRQRWKWRFEAIIEAIDLLNENKHA